MFGRNKLDGRNVGVGEGGGGRVMLKQILNKYGVKIQHTQDRFPTAGVCRQSNEPSGPLKASNC
jgi:hypothetical protein